MSAIRLNVTIGERGQFVIPAVLRRALHLVKGDTITLLSEGNTIKIIPKLNILRSAQALVKTKIPSDIDLVSELISDRRKETIDESKKLIKKTDEK